MQDDLLLHRLGRFFRHPHHLQNILRVGDQALACANVRTALQYLEYKGNGPVSDPQMFTEELRALVEQFQRDVGNRVQDGQVGPSTRRHLVQQLLERYSPAIFERMGLRGARGKPTIFLSYASEDVRKVDKLDQWLSNKGVWVIRDTNAFVPGQEIEQNIRFAVSSADKIVAIYSEHSSKKTWPRLEIALARKLENRLHERILVYVQVDKTVLPKHDPNRLAIPAVPPASVKQVGEALLTVLYEGYERSVLRVEFDENAPL